jgi:hypothetical protein
LHPFGGKNDKTGPVIPGTHEVVPVLSGTNQDADAPPAPLPAASPVPVESTSAVYSREELVALVEATTERTVWTQDTAVPKKLFKRLTNPVLLMTSAAVGIGIATVLTGGLVHVPLVAFGGAAVSANDSAFIEWWNDKRKKVVFLDDKAIDYLVNQGGDVADILSCLLPETAPRYVKLSEPLLRGAAEQIARQRIQLAKSRAAELRGSSSSRHLAGLSLLLAGLFLVAAVIIPEYVQDGILRAGMIIAVLGAIFAAFALIGPLKTPRDL